MFKEEPLFFRKSGTISLTIDHSEQDILPECLYPQGIKIFTAHRKYHFPAAVNLSERDMEEMEEAGGFENWYREVYENDNIKTFPLYMYEHGGIALSIRKFSCSWDSGRLGTVVVDLDEYLQPVADIPLEEMVQCQVDKLEALVNGEVYEIEITEHKYCKCCNQEIPEEAEQLDYLTEILGPAGVKQELHYLKEHAENSYSEYAANHAVALLETAIKEF